MQEINKSRVERKIANASTRICYEVRASSFTSLPLPHEGFLLSPQRNSTENTSLNSLHKRRHKTNDLYTKDGHKTNSSTQDGSTKLWHKAKKKIKLQHFVFTKITNNTSHNIKSLRIDFAMNSSSL